MWILILLFVSSCLATIFINGLRARNRRHSLLRQAGCVFTLAEIESKPQSFVSIVQTNFGYGREVWALKTESRETDLEHRTFKNGVLILPRPRSSELEIFCDLRGIKILQMLIKH